MYADEIICPGTYGGHLQGLALDGDGAIFWSFTVALVKTDPQGNILTQIDVPSHHGDISWHDGMLYVAVNRGKFNETEDLADNWIYAYDSIDLTLVWTHRIPEVFHGAGGMVFQDDHFFVVGGLPEGHEANFVYVYDKDCAYSRKYTLESGYTEKGIQNACFGDGVFRFGCYGNPPRMLITGPDFQAISQHEFDCALGIINIPDGGFLIGRRRDGHENRGRACLARTEPEYALSLVRPPDEEKGDL
jgi:hypothetical protein